MRQERDRLQRACKDFEEDVVLYHYGECRAAEARRVEGHLQECGSCTRFLEELREFLALTGKPQELPESFWSSYYGELQEKLAAMDERRPWWKMFVPSIHSWMLPAFGTAAVVVLALGLTFAKGAWHFGGGRPTQEEVPQELREAASHADFFANMDILDSIDLLEALDSGSHTHNGVRTL